MTDTTCPDCHHQHQGPKLAGICIGCPCETIPVVPPDPHHFVCMTGGCNMSRISSASHNTASEAETNARTAGWSIWSGTTRSGAPSFAVFCPLHNGHVAETDDDEDKETGWDAECDTCMTNAATDDPSFDGTEQAAEEWADDHVCESITRTLPPKTRTVAA